MSALLSEGTLFSGRYCVVRPIATGGMGAVYEVLHTETNRRCALKVMHPHVLQNDELRARFKLEARIAADIESEHIVFVSDAGIDEATQTPFMVMELLRGEELGKRVSRLGALPSSEVLTYLRQTALALDRTHAASIVHRDLKPSNLFLTQRDDGSPRIKILDFGVAKVVAEGATMQGTQPLGTPLYMAPEQFFSKSKLTPGTDIFALGMVAYGLLVGRPYWQPEANEAGDLVAFIPIAVAGPQEPPVKRAVSLGVTLPQAFDEWFFRATAVSSADRFSSAGEAVRALVEVFEPPGKTNLVAPMPSALRATVAAAPLVVVPYERVVPTGTVPAGLGSSTGAIGIASQHPKRNQQVPLLGIVAIVLFAMAVLGTILMFLLRSPESPAPANSASLQTSSVDVLPLPTPSRNVQLPEPEPFSPQIAPEPSATVAPAKPDAGAKTPLRSGKQRSLYGQD